MFDTYVTTCHRKGESWRQEEESCWRVPELSCMQLRTTVVRGHRVWSCRAFSSALNAPGGLPGLQRQVTRMPFPRPCMLLAQQSLLQRLSPSSWALTVNVALVASLPGRGKGRSVFPTGLAGAWLTPCGGNLIPADTVMVDIVLRWYPGNTVHGEGSSPCAFLPASSTRCRSCMP
jgi:hypothetical protein